MRLPREDLRVPDAEADLYLVGLGIGGFERRSVEADQVLATCGVIAHLTAFDERLRETYSAHVIDLAPLYEYGDHALTTYSQMTQAITSAVQDFSFKGPAAFATYGHPLFLVETSWQLLKDQGRLRVKVVPGTSFLDQALEDLSVRIDRAVQVYEATVFVKHRVNIDARFPLLLSQVGDYASDVLRPSGDTTSRLVPLIRRLQEVYPPSRKTYLYLSAWRSDMAPQVHETTISALDATIGLAHVGMSLLVAGDEQAGQR